MLLLDMAIHTFDSARFLVGGTPSGVYCREWDPAGSWYLQGSSAVAVFDMQEGPVFTYRGSWCADGLGTSWESAWRIVGERGSLTWDGHADIRAEVRTGVREGLFDRTEPVDVPPLDPRDRVGGHLGVMQDFLDAIATGSGARNPWRRQHPEPGDGLRRDRERRDRTPRSDQPLGAPRLSNPLLDIRIGTMVRGNLADPAAYVRAILPLGFESIQPFFWQTIGDKDIPRLAGEIREAIGDADVKVGALGMFGNPLEDQPLDRETLAGWETLIDNAHLFGTDIVAGFTGRLRGRPLPESLPRFREVWSRLARRAADRGVRIAFENCAMEGNWASGDWNIAHNPDAWEMMFDALPDENVGLEWEPCHQMVYLIDPIPQIREWAPRIFHVHGKDATVRWDVIRRHGIFGKHRFVEMRTPGFGDSDWARVIGDLRLAGYRGSIDIEGWHDPVYRDDLELTGQKRALDYLRECRGGTDFVPEPQAELPRADSLNHNQGRNRHANQDAHGRNSGHRGAARARELLRTRRRCARTGART